VVERVHQDESSRELILRIDQPAPGVALVGSYGAAGAVRAAAATFFYGSGAEAVAKQFQPVLQRWMADQFPA
jgi:hypothetical protein